MDVGGWLRSLGLDQYEATFRENKIDADLLPRLTADDLKDIGVSAVGDRRRMLDAIATLAGGTPSADASRHAPHSVQPDLFAAARAEAGRGLVALARPIAPRHTWDDIVLPPNPLAQLREICNRATLHHIVRGRWGFDRKLSITAGVSALFSGPSRTGKTIAAEIVASALGLDLYKIDLSQIVSKYIGETEKNLDRIFAAAESANLVLFFDEAAALFGKRTEVKDRWRCREYGEGPARRRHPEPLHARQERHHRGHTRLATVRSCDLGDPFADPGRPKILMTYAFDDREDGGTHFELRIAKPKPKDLPFYEQVWPTVQSNYDVGFQTLRLMLEEQAGSPAVVNEPPVPASGKRFVAHPLHAHATEIIVARTAIFLNLLRPANRSKVQSRRTGGARFGSRRPVDRVRADAIRDLAAMTGSPASGCAVATQCPRTPSLNWACFNWACFGWTHAVRLARH